MTAKPPVRDTTYDPQFVLIESRSSVPDDELRDVLSGLIDYLGLTIYRTEYRPHEYRSASYTFKKNE